MTREELEKMFAYKLRGAAIEYWQAHLQQLDLIETFEAGAEWCKEVVIEMTIEWINAHIFEHCGCLGYSPFVVNLNASWEEEYKKIFE